MRNLKKWMGILLTIIMCLNVCVSAVADPGADETGEIVETQEVSAPAQEEETPPAPSEEEVKPDPAPASNEDQTPKDDPAPSNPAPVSEDKPQQENDSDKEEKVTDQPADTNAQPEGGNDVPGDGDDEVVTDNTNKDDQGSDDQHTSDGHEGGNTQDVVDDTTNPKDGDDDLTEDDAEKLPDEDKDEDDLTEDDAEELPDEESDEIDDPEDEDKEEDEEEAEQLVSRAAPADVNMSPNEVRNFGLEGEYTQKIFINLSTPGYLNLFVRFLTTSQPDVTRATVRFTNVNMTSTYLNSTMDINAATPDPSLVEVSDWFDAGTYVVLVNIIADNGDHYWPISYSVETKFSGANVEASNGNINSAANLPVDGAFHGGLLSRTSNSRWWKMTLSKDGFLEVDVRSFVGGEVDSEVYMLREDQVNRRLIRPLSVTLAPADPQNPTFRFASTWLEAGVYYINVFAKDQKTGRYDLMASFEAANNTESDDDGTYLKANKLALDGAPIRGLLSYTDEVDMFTFNVPDTINVNVSVAAFLNALNVKLYNSNMRTQLLDLSESGTGGDKNKAHNHEQRIRLSKGDYILVVSRDPDKDLTGVYEARVRSTITIKSVILDKGLIYSIGDTVTGKISYVSGKPLEYYFHLQKLNPTSGKYDNVSHITTKNNSFSFKPTEAGVYRVLAQLSDGTYNDEWPSDSFTVKTDTTLNINSIDYDPANPTVGKAMTITAGIGGGKPVKQVNYEIFTSGGTLVDRVTTSGGAAKWTPKTAGTYKTMVVATDGVTWTSKWGGSFTVAAAPTMAISKIEMSTTDAVKKNSPVTFTTTVVNGKPIKYVYETYYFGNFFTRTNSTSNVFTFRPNASGTWKVMVVATDGKQWVSKWSREFHVLDAPAYSVSVTADKTTVPVNGKVNFELKYSGSPQIVYRSFELWLTSPSVRVDVWTGNSDKHAFSFATPGTYRVMGVVADKNGVWKSAWGPTITVAAPPAITLTAVTPNTTSCYVNDVVTYTVSHSTGNPTQYTYEVFNSSNTKIYSKTSTSNIFKYQFKSTGTFRVMAVATDGTNWVSKWSTPVTVSNYGALKILRIDVEGGTSKTFFEPFKVAPVFNSGAKVQKIYFEVYDASTNKLLAKAEGKDASYTYKPKVEAAVSAPFTYKVMVVAYDNEGTWVSKWSDPIVYNLPTALSIVSVTENTKEKDDSGVYGMIELGDSVEFTGTTKDGAEIFESEFQLYYNPDSADLSGATLIDTVNTRNNNSLLTTPTNRGYYCVMYVAFDGITWVSQYSSWIYVTSDA